jgi:hypothetical protein
LDKGYRIKPLKITRERAIFKDCRGKNSTTFQHKIKEVKQKGKEIGISNYSWRRGEGSYIPTQV